MADRFTAAWTRWAFAVTTLYAGLLLWWTPHLPMVDLPQHAGQIALLHDLLAGTSPWRELLQVDLFTPYLLGYGIVLPLTWLMPVAPAMTVVLSLALLAFVGMCVLLRARFGGAPELDWLFIPGFFGFAFLWGMYTFLVAAPLALVFVWLAHRHVHLDRRRDAWALVPAGLLLFFSHGLLFVFAHAIGVTMMLVRHRGWPGAGRLLPYFAGAAPVLAFLLIDRASAHPFHGAPWLGGFDQARLVFPVLTLMASPGDRGYLAALLLLLWAPRPLRLRLQPVAATAWAPWAVVVLIWLACPSEAMRNSSLYQRFALFLLPAYAFLFRPADPQAAPGLPGGRLLLPLVCVAVLANESLRVREFAEESRTFDQVAAAALPGQRALALVLRTGSDAARNPFTYLHYPLWYQAERHGLVDFNFARNPVQVVHYRPGREPAVGPGFEHQPETFDWHRDQGRTYRYFFVRLDVAPDALFGQADCPVTLRAAAGGWWLYERGACPP